MKALDRVSLEILNGPEKGKCIEVDKTQQIGSAHSCSLRLLGQGISSLQASLSQSIDGRWRLRHLAGPKSQTLLNGTEIGEAPIQPGDLIQLGKTQLQILETKEPAEYIPLISKNVGWNEKLKQLPSVARAQHPVLLLGDSGSGKDYLAKNIHELSQRRKESFVCVNCAALNENLIESELFGHKKGSFTGAVNDRSGAFETAHGGTLFLDEIGDMPLGSQAKLLRAIENKEIKAIGSDKNVSVDVRILAATHKDLFALAEQGLFRQDLLYRLNVIQLKVPKLADRKEDLPELLDLLAGEAKVQLSDSARLVLSNYEWPGNIREIKNFFARAQSLFPHLLITEDRVPLLLDQRTQTRLPEKESPARGIPFLKQLEKEMILERLRNNDWNQRRTAMELGIPKSTLHDRIKKYGLIKSELQKNY